MTNKKIKEIDDKTNDHFNKLSRGFDTMSSKFDELFERLSLPKSTATPMDTDVGGKIQ